jgi:hypothetical protein
MYQMDRHHRHNRHCDGVTVVMVGGLPGAREKMERSEKLGLEGIVAKRSIYSIRFTAAAARTIGSRSKRKPAAPLTQSGRSGTKLSKTAS